VGEGDDMFFVVERAPSINGTDQDYFWGRGFCGRPFAYQLLGRQ
jgi:hypothetical protein